MVSIIYPSSNQTYIGIVLVRFLYFQVVFDLLQLASGAGRLIDILYG